MQPILRPIGSRSLALLIVVLGLVASDPSRANDWPAWGGPNGDFMVEGSELAETWPEGGPPRLWARELGEGYSAIITMGQALYTLYRQGERELVIALRAADGSTLWEYGYDAPTKGWTFDRGAGPHATPALAGERLFAVGATGILNALDRTSGSLLWSHDLMKELDASFRHRGYSSSPLVWGDLVIVPVGGQDKTLVAFRQADGSIAWRGGSDDNSYSSPIAIEVDGEPQIVIFAANSILGLHPADGRTLWSHPHPTRNAFNISTPIFGEDGLLFVSSAYDGGGRVLSLARQGDTTKVEELWFSNQVRVHFGTAMRIGDTLYAASGDFGPAPMIAVDVRTGEILWRDRTFAKHSLLRADGKLILLDEDGALGLLEVSRDGMKLLAQAQVFDSLAWTVPTLVGSKLYARTRAEIAAFELGSPSP
jgi:outer membrane protein assembly factor BamB